MNVFLNAEDCAIIAPYIEIPKDWEWWYDFGAGSRPLYQGRPLWNAIPAIDTQLLGVYLLALNNPHLNILVKFKNGWVIIYQECKMPQFFKDKSELENRRDAMMYLIDNNLIEKVRK